MILVFTIDKQIITRRDNEKVVRDSVNYLHVNFSFSEEWTGDKTAVFKSKSGIAYNVLVGSDGSCLVPWEVLKEEYFEVSAFCGDLITANVVKVFTIPSGYEIGSQGRIPTPDIYTQIIARLSAIEAEIDPSAIAEIVDEYISDKGYVTEADVEQIVSDYVEAHKDELKGDTGATGPQGPQGVQGPKGDTGEGVAAGGTTGQVLVKSSNADYETEWGKNALDEFTILTPKNLVVESECKLNFKPDAIVGTSTYADGTTQNNLNTTNLIPCTAGQKFKINLISDPSYIRCFYYNASEVLDSVGFSYSFADDGYITFTAPSRNTIAYLAIVITADMSIFVADYYDSFTLENETIVNDLYFSDKNISMAKKLLGVENVLKGKKWTVIGDSFTAGGWTSQDTPSYIPDGPYEGKLAVYPYLIATRCGMKIQDLSQSGRTMALAADGTNTNSVINQYQRTAADADYLTIYIGINDSHSREAETGQIPLGEITDTTTATFYGAYNTVLTWLITNRPNLHIGLIVSNACDSDDYRVATIALANKYGLPYIDMNGDERTPCMNRSTNANIDSAIRNQRTLAWRVSETNFHPNADAHVYESTFIENFLRSL